jgi:hypothetical protein
MSDEIVTTTVPRGMEVVKPVVGKFTTDQLSAWVRNLLKFTAPSLGIFFAQLSLGVDWKPAGLVALLAFYQAASDFFKKFNGDTPYLREK